jgi:hypothetical protein
MKKKTRRSRTLKLVKDTPRCGLCGKTKNLIKTQCCDNWICDDEDKYVMFSYARNSCSRNHSHFTICGYHHNEGHEGNWQDCQLCRDSFEAEIYADFGTNEYNFEKLKNPPSYEPTKCSICNEIIVLNEGGYSLRGKEYFCAECTEKDFEDELNEIKRKALSEDNGN